MINCVLIKNVQAQSLGEEIGFAAGDLVLSLDEKTVDSCKTFVQLRQNAGERYLKALIQRNEEVISLELKPGQLGVSLADFRAESTVIEAKRQAAVEEQKAKLETMTLMTAQYPPQNKRFEVLGLVTAECVFGTNIFRDVFAEVRDVVGGRSLASEKVLRDLKNTCLSELREEAYKLDADAVIAVDLDYSEISGKGKSMLFLVASGTAVKIIDLETS